MIRGACILAVGFALGYAQAMSQVPEAREFLEALKREWATAEAEKPIDTESTEVEEGETVQ